MAKSMAQEPQTSERSRRQQPTGACLNLEQEGHRLTAAAVTDDTEVRSELRNFAVGNGTRAGHDGGSVSSFNLPTTQRSDEGDEHHG
jgi:hypothetical protein